jgi:hypothetical protein
MLFISFRIKLVNFVKTRKPKNRINHRLTHLLFYLMVTAVEIHVQHYEQQLLLVITTKGMIKKELLIRKMNY